MDFTVWLRSTIGDRRSAKGARTVLKEPRIPMGFPGALGCPKRYPEDSWMKVMKNNISNKFDMKSKNETLEREETF